MEGIEMIFTIPKHPQKAVPKHVAATAAKSGPAIPKQHAPVPQGPPPPLQECKLEEPAEPEERHRQDQDEDEEVIGDEGAQHTDGGTGGSSPKHWETEDEVEELMVVIVASSGLGHLQ
jgi:hypothetical protein